MFWLSVLSVCLGLGLLLRAGRVSSKQQEQEETIKQQKDAEQAALFCQSCQGPWLMYDAGIRCRDCGQQMRTECEVAK